MSVARLELRAGAEPCPGYRLTRCLGRGGLGEVWHADGPAASAVALKFLAIDGSVGAVQELRALQAIRQLKHPNLLRIDNIWSGHGWLVIAMELADGSLHDLLDVYSTEVSTAMPAEHICFFLGQAAAAIDFLNTRQHPIDGRRVAYRHCDIKPSNLLVVGSAVKLSDFSFAVQTTSPMWYHRRTGTLNYAAPEVFQGWLSDRTDLYSLAATYYHLRTGQVPFPDTPTTFKAQYVRPACPDLAPLSEAERPILLRAFAPVPQDRWPSCGEMIARLRRCFDQAPPRSSGRASKAG